MRNNLLAIWGVLTLSQGIENTFEIYSSEESGVKTHSLITEPPRGQRSSNLLSVPMMMSWVYLPSLVMICQRAAEKLRGLFCTPWAPPCLAIGERTSTGNTSPPISTARLEPLCCPLLPYWTSTTLHQPHLLRGF